MADAPYTRSFSFSGFQANQPEKSLPGQRVDIEFDNIAREVAGLRAAIAAGGGGGGLPGPVLDLPIAGRSLKVNLLSSPAIPQIVLIEQFKQELGIGSGGGGLPDWTDIQNKPTFGTAATRDVGASAGTVAAGDDPRIVGALQAAQNGNDIPNKALFRSALGLGAAALLAVGTGPGTVAAGDDPRFSAAAKNVVFYGAKGDGTTDDTAAFQAMYAADKRVVVPPSTAGYVLAGPVGSLTDNAGMQFVGAGSGRTKILMGANAQIQVSGRGWLIEGCTFVANAIVACAIRCGEGEANAASCIRNNHFYSDTPSTGPGAKYFQLVADLYQFWYSRIEGNVFRNGFYHQDYAGTCLRFSYCTNVNVSGNSFACFDTPYHWTALPQNGNAGAKCEGHTISNNIFVANRRNFFFETGLLPMLVNNVVDLTKADGILIENYAGRLVCIGNWFSQLSPVTPAGASAIIQNGGHILIGNAFEQYEIKNQGYALALTGCTLSIFTANSFKGFSAAVVANAGCDRLTFQSNMFESPGTAAVNLAAVTRLKWSGNVNSGAAAVLPPGMQTDKPHYAVTQVLVTPGDGALQQWDVPLPAGRFADTPIVAVSLASDPGSAIVVGTDFANTDTSKVRVYARASTNGVINAGNAIRINLVAQSSG